MSYVDGYVLAVPTANKEAYRELAEKAAKVFTRHGAIQVVETWQDDVPSGKVTDFFRAVDAKENESVVFSWIVWPSKEARDAGNQAAMEDMGEEFSPDSMPFDGKRMIFGGFQAIVEAGSGVT